MVVIEFVTQVTYTCVYTFCITPMAPSITPSKEVPRHSILPVMPLLAAGCAAALAVTTASAYTPAPTTQPAEQAGGNPAYMSRVFLPNLSNGIGFVRTWIEWPGPVKPPAGPSLPGTIWRCKNVVGRGYELGEVRMNLRTHDNITMLTSLDHQLGWRFTKEDVGQLFTVDCAPEIKETSTGRRYRFLTGFTFEVIPLNSSATNQENQGVFTDGILAAEGVSLREVGGETLLMDEGEYTKYIQGKSYWAVKYGSDVDLSTINPSEALDQGLLQLFLAEPVPESADQE
jgi:hypothetical protein